MGVINPFPSTEEEIGKSVAVSSPFPSTQEEVGKKVPVKDVASLTLHLEGQHDQADHGKGGGGSSVEKTRAILEKNQAEFRDAGGRIVVEDDYPQAMKDLDRIVMEVDAAHNYKGMDFAQHAITDAEEMEGLVDLVVAKDEYGYMAGAMSLINTEIVGGEHPVMAINFIGTTGIIEGAGSALVQEAINSAADAGLALTGTPADEDAERYWVEKMGWREDPTGEGLPIYGISAEEVNQLATR